MQMQTCVRRLGGNHHSKLHWLVKIYQFKISYHPPKNCRKDVQGKKKLNRNNTGKITRESLRIVSKQDCKKEASRYVINVYETIDSNSTEKTKPL